MTDNPAKEFANRGKAAVRENLPNLPVDGPAEWDMSSLQVNVSQKLQAQASSTAKQVGSKVSCSLQSHVLSQRCVADKASWCRTNSITCSSESRILPCLQLVSCVQINTDLMAKLQHRAAGEERGSGRSGPVPVRGQGEAGGEEGERQRAEQPCGGLCSEG